jgi:ABC-2 type transport system ATP-binding protein
MAVSKSGALLTLATAALVLNLGACGSSSAPANVESTPASVAYYPGTTNAVPASPAAGQSRAGGYYNVFLKGEGTGDEVAITVFEPATMVGGQKYPLVLQSHGYAGSRQKQTPVQAGGSTLSPGNIDKLIAAGYGAISISERGSDESSGTIRSMDPDYEGKDLLTVLDWAEAHLDWLAYGPSADGSDAHNLIVGSVGGSYGGMFQYLILAIDPKHRLDAIVPQIAPFDLTYSLFPNNTLKAGWGTVLFGAGNTAGNGTDRAHTDPFIINFFENALSTNVVSPEGRDFFYYHSNAYFCNGVPVATNGGAGTTPQRSPLHPGRINAMIFQGFRDTLFTFNNAYNNYLCLRQGGGDVRLLSYQSGHNTLQVVPDPGQAFQPAGDAMDSNCGNVNIDDATLAFFNQHLKGMAGAADSVPTQPCLSLTMGDAVLVGPVTTGHAGMAVDIPTTTVVAGGPLDVAVPVPLGVTAGAGGDVIGGIPRLEVDVEPVNAATPGEPIIFVGIGQMRASMPGVYDLIDNQITPLRGAGVHNVDLAGIAERLAAGDSLALLIYGEHDQYHATGSINAGNPTVMPVTVAGKLWVPMLGALPNIVH